MVPLMLLISVIFPIEAANVRFIIMLLMFASLEVAYNIFNAVLIVIEQPIFEMIFN